MPEIRTPAGIVHKDYPHSPPLPGRMTTTVRHGERCNRHFGIGTGVPARESDQSTVGGGLHAVP